MKKIAIVTLYKDNFGSILQAYATCTYLKSLKYDCDILQNKISQTYFKKIKKIPIVLYRCIRYKKYFKERRTIKKTSEIEGGLLSENTKQMMNEFVNNEFKIKNVDNNNLKSLNNEYDYFITGSDQVWNGYDEFRYLVFADRCKRIALAPSFGAGDIKPYFKNSIRVALKGFNNLSVREESGVKLIKALLGKEAVRLSDPTVLLSKKEWNMFAAHGMKKSNYILIHFLNTPNETAIEVINDYLREHSCMAYCICNDYKEYNKLKKHEFIDINPYDYVSLISNANYVFTDSFHSSLFSLNLETRFVTFERQYLHGNSQSSRIEDLLKRVDMSNKFVNQRKINLDFDREKMWDSDTLFINERTKIYNYIKIALEG